MAGVADETMGDEETNSLSWKSFFMKILGNWKELMLFSIGAWLASIKGQDDSNADGDMYVSTRWQSLDWLLIEWDTAYAKHHGRERMIH